MLCLWRYAAKDLELLIVKCHFSLFGGVGLAASTSVSNQQGRPEKEAKRLSQNQRPAALRDK